MRTAVLGDAGVRVSALCLGCMFIGTRVDERTSMRSTRPRLQPLTTDRMRAQASPARFIASVSNIVISVASPPKTARLAAFQLAIFAAPYM